MQKRGESVLFFLFTVILALIAGVVFINIGIKIGSNEIFLQQNFADNVAMAADTLQAAPGNVEYHFIQNTSTFLVVMEEDQVKVTRSGTGLITETIQKATERTAKYVPRPRDVAPEFRSIADHEPYFWLTKEGNIITFSSCEGNNNEFCSSTEEAKRAILNQRLATEVTVAIRTCANKAENKCVCGTFSASIITRESELKFSDVENGGMEIIFKKGDIEIKNDLVDVDFCERIFEPLTDPLEKEGMDIATKSESILKGGDDDELQEKYLFSSISGEPGVPVLLKYNGKVCVASRKPEINYYFGNNGITNENQVVLMDMCK